MIFVDIICYLKGQSNDPFSALSRLYHMHTSSRENRFLLPTGDPVVSDEDASKVEYELGLILLPHQIILLPRDFLINSSFDVADKLTHKEKDEIRYI